MNKTFAVALRDLINQYYALGISQAEVVEALINAEAPQQVEEMRKSIAMSAELPPSDDEQQQLSGLTDNE